MGPTEQDIEQRPVFPQHPGFPPPFSAFDQPEGKKLAKNSRFAGRDLRRRN